MYGYVVLFTVLVSVHSVCNYTNQSPAQLIVTKTGGVIETSAQFNITTGQKFDLSCMNSSQSLAYNEKKQYICENESNSIDLPICVDKCNNYIALISDSTRFSTDGVEVNGSVAAYTPLTIICYHHTAQSFGVRSELQCERWSDNMTCKAMCLVLNYNSSTTIVSSSQLSGSYLPEQATLTISCVDSYYLPITTVPTIKCNNAAYITIDNCTALCVVPPIPDNQTKYHTNSEKLRQGESFTVTCSGDKEIRYGGSKIAKCVGSHYEPTSHYSNGIPVCEPTCKVGAVSDSTIYKPTVNGNIRQGEGFIVSCIKDHLLPYPAKTPITYVCDNSGQFSPPSCQKQCNLPKALTKKSRVSRYKSRVSSDSDDDVLSQYEPVTVSCIQYYKFSSGISVRTDWVCEDGVVTITSECYVYSKVEWYGRGTQKISFTSDLPNTAPNDTKVKVAVEGHIYNIGTTIILNGTYQPYTVEVLTTSEGDNTVTTQLTKVYPGPPSPTVTQQDSTGSMISINLTTLYGVLYETIPTYILKYNGGNLSEKLITVNSSEYSLYGLSPSSNYTVTVRTKLPLSLGGLGNYSQQAKNIYTGPASVTEITAIPRDSTLEITWKPPTNELLSYTVYLNNSNEKRCNTSSCTFVNLHSETDYTVIIIPKVNRSGILWDGDQSNKTVTSGPGAPTRSLFNVEYITGTVLKLSFTKTKRSAKKYLIFIHDKNMSINASTSIIEDLQPGTKNNPVSVAQISGKGYGKKLILGNWKAADCKTLELIGANTSDNMSFVEQGTIIKVKCSEDKVFMPDTYGLSEIEITCKAVQEYQFKANKNNIVLPNNIVECNKDAEKVISGDNTNVIYGVVGTLLIVIVIVCIILIVMIHRRKRITGSYNAKKAGQDMSSPEPVNLDDEVFFENMQGRGYSKRSKATSYGSQELRMELTDSGITEDILFNPVLHSTLCFEDDNISTKSALV